MTPATMPPHMRRRDWAPATVWGGVIAVLGGLIGLGGAEFRLPVLMDLFGLAPRRAVPLNLLISLVTVATALATRALQGGVAPAWEWRLAIAALIVGGVVGARVGVRLAGRLHATTLERVIAGLLMAIAMLLGIEAAAGDALLDPFVARDTPVAISGLSLGLVIGVISSLLGVAGGELLIPTFVFVFGADIKTAGTASLLVSLPTVAVGVLRYRASGSHAAQDSVRHVGLPMALGSLARAKLGTGLVGGVDVRVLKAVLAVVLAVSALRMWRSPQAAEPTPIRRSATH
jgi:uncharacterized membrane protein YfcA